MNLANYHTHSHYCHGEGELESYVVEAIKKKMHSIGFSSHAPVPFESDWHMQFDHLDKYISEIEHLKEKYKEISIYSGLEVDYIPGELGPEAFRDRNLDLIVGSVHYTGRFENQNNCCFDNTKEEFERVLKSVFNNDIKKLVTRYYEIVVEMVKNDPPDIIGHLDIIKKLNSNSRYFIEGESWYQEIINGVIEAISTTNIILEVNTRGYYQSITNEFYPGRHILEKCFEANIPVTISSDAHHPNELVQNFEEVKSVLMDIGYNHIHLFDNGIWSAAPIQENGSGFKEVNNTASKV